MNNKGNLGMIGLVITAFIGLLVGIVLLNGGIYENVGTVTNTRTATNLTVTSPANGSTAAILGQAIEGSVTVTNETHDDISSEFIFASSQVLNGAFTGTITTNIANNANKNVNLSYTYQPDGYIQQAGGRSVAGLIAVFAALAVAVFALVPALRSGVLNGFK